MLTLNLNNFPFHNIRNNHNLLLKLIYTIPINFLYDSHSRLQHQWRGEVKFICERSRLF